MTVTEIKGKTVKIGFNFPKEASIMRKELHDRIMEQNLAASLSGGNDDFMEAFGKITGKDDE